ncbi:MAG: FtsX-like permease family protein [Actinomycetes bacterium]|nr:FtsX-like permease family protein [Actinomycetes bacterium]
MNLFKIALRNVKKSMSDYAIYFLTLTFGICIFYVFNSLDAQREVMGLSSQQMQALKYINQIMGTLSVFVSAILGFLIIYANRFLIKRRKREFGIYLTLGMQKKTISGILIAETLQIGLASLLCGFALGIFLSQLMATLTAKLLGAQFPDFHFILSTGALVKTCLYFGLAFLSTLLFNVVAIHKQKLIDLIYADRKNEWNKMPRQGLSVTLFLFSVLLLIFSYLGIQNILPLGPNALGTATMLCVAGTFLFFFSLSGFFLRLVQQNKRIYFKHLNLFVLRQISSKINTTYVSITMVCLMLAISISTFSAGMGISGGITESLNSAAPFDASLSVSVPTDAPTWIPAEYPGINIVSRLEKKGVDLHQFAREFHAIRYYGLPDTLKLKIKGSDTIPLFVKLSDYNTALAMQKIAPLKLDAHEFALNANVGGKLWQKTLTEYAGTVQAQIKLNKTLLHTKPELVRAHTLAVSTGFAKKLIVVVPDKLIAKHTPALEDVLIINYLDESPRYEKACVDALAHLNFDSGKMKSMDVLTTRTQLRERSNTTTATLAYLTIYLGIVFLITAAAVLAISQLSETSDAIVRYRLLRKIGTDDRMIRQALFRQILIMFAVPLLLALVHAMVALSVASRMAQLLARIAIWQSALVTGGVIVVVYGGYFLATYIGSKNILRKSMSG